MYCKVIKGKLVLPPHNDGNRINVHLDEEWLIGHGFADMTSVEINAAKLAWAVEHPDKHNWQDKVKFIGAVKSLVPADKLAEIMSDPAKLRDAIAGIALLATDAAPGGMIDVADPRVAEFLSLSGLTVEEVKGAME